MSDIFTNTENALKLVFGAGTLATNVYTGISAETLLPPYVVCSCNRADEHPPYSNNYNTEVEIFVVSAADDGLGAHQTRVGAVRSIMGSGTIAADLTSYGTDYHAFGAHTLRLSPTVFDADERLWSTTLGLSIYSCAKDIS